MPPKKEIKKHPRSDSPPSTDSEAPDKKAKVPRATATVIGNRTEGPLTRSPEVLSCLNEKKTEKQIWEAVTPFVRRTKDSEFNPAEMYKFGTWNVMSLRGLLRKNESALRDLLHKERFDIFCLQETKLNPGDAGNETLGVVEGYSFVDHPCAAKNGYSGTRTYVKNDRVRDALGARHARGLQVNPTSEGAGDAEGRVLTTWLSPPSSAAAGPTIAVVNTYIPNSGMKLDRLAYRVEDFDQKIRQYLQEVDQLCVQNAKDLAGKAKADAAEPFAGFIWTGDLNVAQCDFDRFFGGNWKTMQQCACFTPEERWSFRDTLSATKSVDAFRYLYPNAAPVYTFWSMRFNGRSRGMGWRLDYFVLPQRLARRVVDCYAMPEVMGSDHCPVQLWLKKQ
ncbi:unnamed protein product [Phytomonas sp. EM1]|nr:unnamed protein product [Phytomonas sp. EM1]|eukprot:CCW64994.1 unnamed protein product [Phytomonas sp. isolate EM1]